MIQFFGIYCLKGSFVFSVYELFLFCSWVFSLLLPDFLHLRCIINPCLWREFKSLRLRLSSDYFVMLVCVFRFLWPCRSLFFEGACNRNILSGWAEAKEALQMSFLLLRWNVVLSAAAPGAEEPPATWTPRAPQSAGRQEPGPWLSKLHFALFLGCVTFPPLWGSQAPLSP